MMKIKASEIPDAVNGIPAPLRDTLMKYVYKGFENPKDYSSSALLTWHEKVFLFRSKTSFRNKLDDVIRFRFLQRQVLVLSSVFLLIEELYESVDSLVYE